jgi:hypothetical protein
MKCDGNTPFARHGLRWEGNKNRSQKIRWVVGDRIHLAQNREKWQDVVSTVMKLRVP